MDDRLYCVTVANQLGVMTINLVASSARAACRKLAAWGYRLDQIQALSRIC